MKELSIREIEEAVSAAADEGEFGVSDLIKRLKVRKSKALEERVERTLSGDGALFSRDGKYLAKRRFFVGRRFVVVPSDYEIENRILFAGHRFAPFCAEEVFPSEISLECDGGAVAPVEVECDIQTVFSSHLLLGAEHISDYLVAEHKDNLSLDKAVRSGKKLKLTARDMAAFYDRHDFSGGDALLCTVLDFDRGAFAAEFLSGKKRRDAAVRKSCAALAEAVGLVADRFAGYLDLPEALGWAYYLGDAKQLFGAQSAGLDEFVLNNETIDIAFDNGSTSFARRAEPGEADSFGGDGDGECGCGHSHGHDELPDGVSISRGAIDSFGALLKDIGSTVSCEEIDGAILDACYARELIFDDFFQRLFDRDKLNFADAAQEAVFFNCLEDRWEELTNSYDRAGDEPKAELRARLLELADARRARLEEWAALDADLSKAPEAELHRLSEMAIYSNDLLRLLNDLEQEMGDAEREKLEDSLDRLEDIQTGAMEAIAEALHL